jgi:hypothetical protein
MFWLKLFLPVHAFCWTLNTIRLSLLQPMIALHYLYFLVIIKVCLSHPFNDKRCQPGQMFVLYFQVPGCTLYLCRFPFPHIENWGKYREKTENNSQLSNGTSHNNFLDTLHFDLQFWKPLRVKLQISVYLFLKKKWSEMLDLGIYGEFFLPP